MRKRYEQPAEHHIDDTLWRSSLPVDRPAAIYYRQSTESQVGNISTAMQTEDLVSLLQKYGWEKERIVLIDADAGVSGSKKIDERPGMSYLFRLITTQAISAIACQDVDRLFRDATQIQSHIFIEACRAAHVLVITPQTVYDFADPSQGELHATKFAFRSEAAADYMDSQVKGKLHPAKRRLLMNGLWAGPPIPPGYMIDMRKELSDGRPNPNWRKLAIFEPYAAVVRAWWELFLRYDGQLRPTCRHILNEGPYYPDPSDCTPPDGFKVVYRLRRNKGKWCISRRGFKEMLTNALYLGHWLVNGRIVIPNNHPAIIDEATFMETFRHLSKVELDGQPNSHYESTRRQASLEPSQRGEAPLCSGMLLSQDVDGAWLRVDTRWSKSNNHYAYELWSKADDVSMWCRKAAFVDAAVSDSFIQKLDSSFDLDAWAYTLRSRLAEVQQDRELKQAQLSQLRNVMSNLELSLGALTLPELIRGVERRYADALIEAERLQQNLAAFDAEVRQIEHIEMLPHSRRQIAMDWPHMTRDQQRQTLQVFIEYIEVQSKDNCALQLSIHWRDGSRSSAQVAGRVGVSLRWTYEEEALLVTLFARNASQVEIAYHLPHRTWGSIQQRYWNLVKPEKRHKSRRKQVMEDTESYSDWLLRTAGHAS